MTSNVDQGHWQRQSSNGHISLPISGLLHTTTRHCFMLYLNFLLHFNLWSKISKCYHENLKNTDANQKRKKHKHKQTVTSLHNCRRNQPRMRLVMHQPPSLHELSDTDTFKV